MSNNQAKIEAIVKTAVSKSSQQAKDLLKTPKNYNQIKSVIKNKLQSSIVSFLLSKNEITGDIFKQLHQHFLNDKLLIVGEPIIEPTSANNTPYSAIFDFRDLDNQQDFSIELELTLAFYTANNEERCKIEEIEIKNIFTVSEMKAQFNKVNTLLKTFSKKELYLLLSNFT